MSSSRAKQNRPSRRLTAVYRRGFEDGRRAALSAAEPVAWLVRLYANDGSLIKEQVYREKPDIRSTAGTDFIPLYTAPAATPEAMKALHENDAVWARFYRDGKTLGEICEEFNCGIYDLSPWLTAPLARSALSAQVQDVADGAQIMKAWKKLRELEGKLPHALGMIIGDALDELRPIIARIQSAAPAKQEGGQ